MPDNYPGLLRAREAFGNLVKHIHFYQLPKTLAWCFKLAQWPKNLFQKNKESSDKKIPALYFRPEKVAGYFADLKKSAQFIYFFSWLFYLFLEILRTFVASLKEKPVLFYGYEISGAKVASILGGIFRKPVVTRFQGTALDIKKRAQWKYFPSHVLGLKSAAEAIIMGSKYPHSKLWGIKSEIKL